MTNRTFIDNNIIPKDNNIVNEPQEKVISKFQEHKLKSLAIADKLTAIDEIARGGRMRNCGDYVVIERQGEKTRVKSANLCRDRLCSICRWRLSLKRFSDMMKILEYLKTEEYNFYLLTLTIRNCKPQELEETLCNMSSAWNRLLQRRWIKRTIQGMAKSIEITYNKTTFTFHPHMHIILASKSPLKDIEGLNLAEAWNESLRLSYKAIWDFTKIENRVRDDLPASIAETFKYAVKDKSMDDMPLNIFKTFTYAINNKRLISYIGVFKTARQALKLSDEIEETEDFSDESPISEYVFKWAGMKYELQSRN